MVDSAEEVKPAVWHCPKCKAKYSKQVAECYRCAREAEEAQKAQY